MYPWAKIQQAVSQISLLSEFLIGKELVKDKDRRILTLGNFNPDF
jgi:hypothetical protein